MNSPTIEVLRRVQRLFREALPKFEWGASPLDANAITLLNEVPAEVDKLLAAPHLTEPVTFVWTTTIREHLEDNTPDEKCGDDWTKGYEECKRRILRMLQQPINEKFNTPASEGPQFSDGCDHEGFPGGCERFGHTVETYPTPTAQEPDDVEHRTIKDIIGEWLAGMVSSDNALEEIKARCEAAPTPPITCLDPSAMCEEVGCSIGCAKTAPEVELVAYQFRDKFGVNMLNPGPWINCSRESYDRLSKLNGWEVRKICTYPELDKK